MTLIRSLDMLQVAPTLDCPSGSVLSLRSTRVLILSHRVWESGLQALTRTLVLPICAFPVVHAPDQLPGERAQR